MAALWDNKKQTSLDREKASQRLDCFLSILYLYPNCIEVKDMDMLAKRENELSDIYKYSARAFLGLYIVGVAGYYGLKKGTMPFFKDVTMHTVLGLTGTFGAGYLCEKIAAEFYYNQIMIQMADKYNFTPEEVMDLQRNLN